MELLVLGLLATVGIASYALWSRARNGELQAPPQRPPELPAAERTPSTLLPGDVVSHLGTDWLVEGVLSLSEESRGARVSRVTDGSKQRVLVAVPSEPEPALLEVLPLKTDALGETISHAGHSYQLKQRLSGTAVKQGAGFDKRAGQRLTLALYASGALRLLLLAWPDGIEASAGERIPLHLVEILPGR
jgi:hypothetical protein